MPVVPRAPATMESTQIGQCGDRLPDDQGDDQDIMVADHLTVEDGR